MNTTIRASRRAAAWVMAVSLAFLGAQDVAAQKDNRAGTAAAPQLLIPSTARNSALGNNSTSGLDNMNGLEALYSNPAGLTVNSGTSAIFSRMQYVADIGVNYFGIAQRIGSNNIALTMTSWDMGDIPKQTEAQPEITSVTYSAPRMTLGFSYARQLTDRIAAGTTLKVVNEAIDDVSTTAFALDAGMTYLVGETGLRMGVSLQNIGSEMKYSGPGLNFGAPFPGSNPSASPVTANIEAAGAELPSMLNFGVAYTRDLGGQGSVTLMGNFRSNSFDQDQLAGGIELGFQDIVFVRGGYQYQEDPDRSFFTGASVGAGLNLNLGSNRLSVDYAYIPTDFFDAVQYITAAVTL